tara:strand:+ start:677 stop:988 length:312 start_codon:yes stop_codon:yes gene_type:complete
MIQLERQLAIFSNLHHGQQSIHHLQMLMFIGREESCTYQDIEKQFHLSNAAVSRSMNALAETPRHRKTGLNLIEIYRDPREGRRYRVRLAKKGKLIYDQILAA